VSVLYIVVPAALILVIGAIVAFVWAARRGQFDDVTTPALRVALDDDETDDRGGPDSPAAVGQDASDAP
jgi:cbb3-type cytochrome oxidase maturation protein